MIFKTKPLKTILYTSSTPLEDMKIENVYNRNKNKSLIKPVLFCRYIGYKGDEQSYYQRLQDIDYHLINSTVNYVKITEGLDRTFNNDEVHKYKQIIDSYMKLESITPFNPLCLISFDLGLVIADDILEWTKKLEFRKILTLFRKNNPHTNSTVIRNFGIKILIWMDIYIKKLFTEKVSSAPKLIYYGSIKEHEYYFLILLSKLGCDILYINPKDDIRFSRSILEYSTLTINRCFTNSIIPFPQQKENNVTSQKVTKPIHNNQETTNNIHISSQNTLHQNTATNSKIEKSYEELAKLSTSIVMIKVYNKNKKVIGGGSGVAIKNNGYIITNFHVVRKGFYFGVLFENDETEYLATNIIKYHTDFDLALLKVERNCTFVPLNDKALVRGQKIITIGSPLGLFNTISEGIVSGFRSFDDNKMIQITAPMSAGSSGGALIDLYGNLVGITTAGYNEGQNLNLAVPAEYIKFFANQYLSSR
ncbi:YceG family protein [Clostridiaceae bacterium M8S5]|nr:YceG family protein [Clostridiaceae bacterium M8S5]